MTIFIAADDPKNLPCVLQVMQRTGFTKIAVTAWCKREVSASDGALLQMPDASPGCPACTAAIKSYEAQIAAARAPRSAAT